MAVGPVDRAAHERQQVVDLRLAEVAVERHERLLLDEERERERIHARAVGRGPDPRALEQARLFGGALRVRDDREGQPPFRVAASPVGEGLLESRCRLGHRGLRRVPRVHLEAEGVRSVRAAHPVERHELVALATAAERHDGEQQRHHRCASHRAHLLPGRGLPAPRWEETTRSGRTAELLVGVPGAQHRRVVEVPADEHHADRQAVRHAARHAEGGVARDVER